MKNKIYQFLRKQHILLMLNINDSVSLEYVTAKGELKQVRKATRVTYFKSYWTKHKTSIRYFDKDVGGYRAFRLDRLVDYWVNEK